MENKKIPTYEEFMALLEESRKRDEERWAKQEQERMQREQERAEREKAREQERMQREIEHERWKRERDEEDKRLTEKIEKLGEKIGGIENNIGYHAEQFFQDTFEQTLTFGGEKYGGIIPNLKYSGKGENAEFDIVLVNGKSIAIIEIKNRIHPNFVKQIAEEKIVKFRKFFPMYNECKAYLGIAGFSFSSAVIEEARKYGVGIIKQVGKSVEVIDDNLKAY